jgi:hypothetical protein
MSESIKLTHEQAADAEQLAAAVAESKSTGRPLVIGEAGKAPTLPTGSEALAAIREPLVIPRGVTPQEYQRLKAEAQKSGRAYVMGPDPEPEKRVYAPGTVMIPRDASPDVYRRMKADAETRGVPYAMQEA